MSLKERLEKYIENNRYYLMSKVPVVFSISINNISKIELDQPYDDKFEQAMTCTMLKLSKEIEGCIFAYRYFDEILIISRNDQKDHTQPWYDNDIQKLASISSSIATNEFAKIFQSEVELYFTSHVFTLPSMTEATTYVASVQNKNIQKTLNLLSKDVLGLSLNECFALSFDEKINLLKEEGVYYDTLPTYYKKGLAVYKKLENDKLKWFFDENIPVFLSNKDFLYSIFLNS